MRADRESCLIFDGHDGVCIDIDESQKSHELYVHLRGPLMLKHNAELAGTRKSDDPLKVTPNKKHSLLVDHEGVELSHKKLLKYITDRFEADYVCLIYNGKTGECMTKYHKVEGDKLAERQWKREYRRKLAKSNKNKVPKKKSSSNFFKGKVGSFNYRCWHSYEAYLQGQEDVSRAFRKVKERNEDKRIERLLREAERKKRKNKHKD